MPPCFGGILIVLLAFLVFGLRLALLVSDTAAGLASRLARSLAFAATAVLCALAEATGLQRLNVFHNAPPKIYATDIIPLFLRIVKKFAKKTCVFLKKWDAHKEHPTVS